MAKKHPLKPPTRGSFTKNDDRAKQARAKNDQSFYRDEMTQILISVLNETWHGQTKANKYLLIERLVALAIGVKIKVGSKTFEFAPDRAAIREVLDRLIGRPAQAHVMQGDDGKGPRLTIVFDEPGDADV